MIRLGTKYNRSYDLYFEFKREHLILNVLFNRNNLYTAFNIDRQIYQEIKSSDSRIDIFFDVHKSLFCDTFMELRDMKSSTIDIKNQFYNILPEYRDLIQIESRESLKLSDSNDNTISIYTFRFKLYRTNFLYCLTERQHIDQINNKKVVRTAGFQLASKDSYLYMQSLCEKRNTPMIEPQICSEAFKDIFESTTQQHIDRGGLL